MPWVYKQQNSKYKKLYRINNPVVSVNEFQGRGGIRTITRLKRQSNKLQFMNLKEVSKKCGFLKTLRIKELLVF